MSKVTCKFCNKVWHNRAEYLQMKTCDHPACPAMAMRNQRVEKEQEVKKPPVLTVVPKVEQVPLKVNYNEADVLSYFDSNEDCLEVEVPKVICIDIRRVGRKK